TDGLAPWVTARRMPGTAAGEGVVTARRPTPRPQPRAVRAWASFRRPRSSWLFRVPSGTPRRAAAPARGGASTRQRSGGAAVAPGQPLQLLVQDLQQLPPAQLVHGLDRLRDGRPTLAPGAALGRDARVAGDLAGGGVKPARDGRLPALGGGLLDEDEEGGLQS